MQPRSAASQLRILRILAALATRTLGLHLVLGATAPRRIAGLALGAREFGARTAIALVPQGSPLRNPQKRSRAPMLLAACRPSTLRMLVAHATRTLGLHRVHGVPALRRIARLARMAKGCGALEALSGRPRPRLHPQHCLPHPHRLRLRPRPHQPRLQPRPQVCPQRRLLLRRRRCQRRHQHQHQVRRRRRHRLRIPAGSPERTPQGIGIAASRAVRGRTRAA
mmetsp:Transcript_28950/g.72723  ORF Transcript_28950/g.72723 Transcript_28950/m.72723 type:complete len:223 (-) Transcript_28950:533-1201(-)